MARGFTIASSQELRNATLAAATAAPLTMACWFRPSDVAGGTSKILMALDDAASEFFALQSIATTGACRATVTGGFVATAPGTPSNGVWAHVAGVFVSSTSRFAYLNGAIGAEGTDASTPVVTQTRLGALHGTAQFTAGDIAEAAIWNVALNASEIQQLARGYSPLLVRKSSLVAYWPLNAGASPEPDRSLQARVSLTLMNAPPLTTHPPGIIYGEAALRGGRRARR